MGSSRAILAVAVLIACGAAFLLLRGRGDGPTDGPGRSQGSGPRGPLSVEGAPPPLAAGPCVPKDAIAEPPTTSTPAAADPASSETLDPADRPAWWPASATDGHRAVRLRVRCVNGATGETVAARWRLLEAITGSAPVVPWIDSRWRGDALVATTVPARDGSFEQNLEIVAPDGFLSREEVIGQRVAADATAATLTVLLWPAFDLELTLRGPDGSPAQDVSLDEFSVAGASVGEFGGEDHRFASLSDDRGVVRIERLPFVPGAELRARAVWRTVSVPVFGGVELTEEERARPPIIVRLADTVTNLVAVELPIEGPTGGDEPETGRDRARPDVPVSLELEEGIGSPRGPADPATVGRVRVRVRGAGGRPVGQARVTSDPLDVTTGANGAAELSNVEAGDREVWVSVPGGFRWSTRVSVVAGSLVDVELREPEAARLEVEVVDERGRPCPFASISARAAGGSATYDVEDGVQRLDDLTDASGRRSFRRVAPGEASLVAWWRGREGRAQVVVEERGRATARVVVR
jgi:hypothetical protein